MKHSLVFLALWLLAMIAIIFMGLGFATGFRDFPIIDNDPYWRCAYDKTTNEDYCHLSDDFKQIGGVRQRGSGYDYWTYAQGKKDMRQATTMPEGLRLVEEWLAAPAEIKADPEAREEALKAMLKNYKATRHSQTQRGAEE
ncbi:MAG: hypothetical protein ISN29_00680 [Gammaproteobacteria bacterium AqS3]|nr:hypothetical protein [Gammaproteobacteria bacterium AqS3]